MGVIIRFPGTPGPELAMGVAPPSLGEVILSARWLRSPLGVRLEVDMPAEVELAAVAASLRELLGQLEGDRHG